MKTKNLGRGLFVVALLVLMGITAISCSDRDRSANQTSDRDSTIFEKGKTYVIVLGTPYQLETKTVTVMEIGPHQWLKVNVEDRGSLWLNSRQVVWASEGQPTPTSTSSPS